MLKELKYLLHLLTIFIFFFILIKFYLSDSYEKKLYRSLNNYDEVIKKYSKNLPLLENDTQNVIEYVDNNTDKSKKKYKFWKLIEND
jgi:ABC-type dipeptide/oligopeptide/nickel transport system permease component